MEKYEKWYDNSAGTILRLDNSTFAVYHYSMSKGAQVCTVVDYNAICECKKDFVDCKIRGIENAYDLLIYRLQFMF